MGQCLCPDENTNYWSSGLSIDKQDYQKQITIKNEYSTYHQMGVIENLNKENKNIKPIKEERIKPQRKKTYKSRSLDDIKKPKLQIDDDKLCIVLLGLAGVGKSRLIQQMKVIPNQDIHQRYSGNFDKNKDKDDVKNQAKFIEVLLDKQYIIIDTPSFQLDDDIEIRENFIKEFQSYFENRKQISSFGIVVNFERTDLMKKKVLQVLKYVRKFIKIISIIVVNMELSENEEEDKQHLRNSFKYMGYNQIIFINKNMNQKQIIQEIKQIKFKKQQIDFTDTIFENCDIINELKIQKQITTSLHRFQTTF